MLTASCLATRIITGFRNRRADRGGMALIGKEQLFRQSGLQFMPFNTIYQLYAMVKAGSPKLESSRNLAADSGFAHVLHADRSERSCEFTMATTTQLYNPKTRCWNTPLLDQLQIPKGLFLPPVPPGTIIGALTRRKFVGVKRPCLGGDCRSYA